MNQPHHYSFIRYLEAKQSVDDRALSRNVLQVLGQELSAYSHKEPLRVLELGAGIGTMIERMLAWRILSNAEYTALDSQEELIEHTRFRLTDWSQRAGYRLELSTGGELRLRSAARKLFLRLLNCDLFDYLANEGKGDSYDLLVANAFLDLVDLERALPAILKLLKDGGLFYFTINFDGLTHFEPEINPDLDAKIIKRYHRTMDERRVADKPSGDSRTGRHLFKQLEMNNAKILAAGSSDWIVFPDASGYYKDEAYFLHYIIHSIHTALSDDLELDREEFADWILKRHAQVENKELIYIAHQLDFVGRYKVE